MDIKLHAPRGTMVSLGWSNRGGGGGGGGDEGIPPESLFQLYGGSGAGEAGDRNQVTAATYTRGFELWQQQQQQIQRQQQYSFYPPSAGLLNFGDPVGAGGSSRRAGGGGIGTVEFGMRGRGGSGGVSCQDCGNQSKKDCAHMRCRTCCKSRGFPCPTHVKSTWIPASKRRERQQLSAAASALQQQSQLAGSGGGGGEPCKRPREISTRLSTAIATTSSGNGGDAPSFPAEVSSPVVFRCVRVSPIDDAEDELAYQTEVRVQGHVFKGILYDYGPDVHRAGESSSLSAAAAVLTTTTTTTTAAIGTSIGAAAVPAVDAAAARAGLLDTSPLYPPPFGAFMAGSQFFPHHPRP